MKKVVLDILYKTFRPEFLNRIDETVVFHSLSRENIVDIARLQVAYLVRRIKERGIEVTFDPKALEWIAEKGYDPNFGARPLKRVIQNLVETPLAKHIVKGDFAEGDGVQVEVRGEELALRKRQKKAA
jgi:ATP-dependent Clp protease ATP-binding subunit ClpB